MIPQVDASTSYYVDESAAVVLSPSSATQIRPDIDGNNVVWLEGESRDLTLYAMDLANPSQPAKAITSGYITSLQVDGDRVVYHLVDDGHVYLVDLSQADPQPLQLSTYAAVNNSAPTISGDLVVWSRQAVPPDQGFVHIHTELYGIDLTDVASGEFLVSANNWVPMTKTPALNGTDLVYTQNQALLMDMNDLDAAPILLDGGTVFGDVEIDSDWIIWNRSIGGSLWQIYVTDMNDPVAGVRPMFTSAMNQLLSDISGDIVLYRSSDYSSTQILGIDLSDPNATPFEVIVEGPRVHGDYVNLSGDTFVYSQDGVIYLNHILPEPTTTMMLLFGGAVLINRRLK